MITGAVPVFRQFTGVKIITGTNSPFYRYVLFSTGIVIKMAEATFHRAGINIVVKILSLEMHKLLKEKKKKSLGIRSVTRFPEAVH